MPKLIRNILDRAARTTTPAVPLPRRGDHIEAWLKAQRDEYGWLGTNDQVRWNVLDQALDDYRLHADTGTPLHEHVCEQFCDCKESGRG
jgi:hypothetical protein